MGEEGEWMAIIWGWGGCEEEEEEEHDEVGDIKSDSGTVSCTTWNNNWTHREKNRQSRMIC